MNVFNNAPTNPNFLSPANFSFNLAKLPAFSYNVTKVEVPSVMLQAIKSPTMFRPMQVYGNATDYGKLTVTYKLDEDMEIYKTLFDWLNGLGIPDNFAEHETLIKNKINGKYSDASLTLLTAQKNSNFGLQFTDCFPTDMTGFVVETDVNDIQYVSSTVSFAFQQFKVGKL